jgi:hypothetical protein
VDFAKEIPDFIYRIVVPGILPHKRLGGSLFSFIILSLLVYYNELIFFSKEKI